VPGTAFGSKSLVELYSTPTDKTMVEAEGSYSTAFREYYEQFQVGYAALWPEVYIGPEAIFLGEENYDEYRFGAFVSGIKIGKVELGFRRLLAGSSAGKRLLCWFRFLCPLLADGLSGRYPHCRARFVLAQE